MILKGLDGALGVPQGGGVHGGHHHGPVGGVPQGILMPPFSNPTASPPVVKVPQKNTFFAFWVMLIKPPHPAMREPNLLTLMFPDSSAWARPRNA